MTDLLPYYSALIESLTLLAIVGGWILYNEREKKRLLEEKKIDTYSELIYALQDYYLACSKKPIQAPSEEKCVQLDKAYSKALLYGSDLIKSEFKKLRDVKKGDFPMETSQIPSFVLTMVKEIQSDTTLLEKDILPFLRYKIEE